MNFEGRTLRDWTGSLSFVVVCGIREASVCNGSRRLNGGENTILIFEQRDADLRSRKRVRESEGKNQTQNHGRSLTH